MTTRANLKVVERRIKAKVKDGVVVVDPTEGVAIADGTSVTLLVDDEALFMPDSDRLDENGVPIWSAADLAEIKEGIAEADRGEGIPAHVVIAEMRRKYGRQ